MARKPASCRGSRLVMAPYLPRLLGGLCCLPPPRSLLPSVAGLGLASRAWRVPSRVFARPLELSRSRLQSFLGPYVGLPVPLVSVCSELSLIFSLRMGPLCLSDELTRHGLFPLTSAFPLSVIPLGSTCQHVGFWWVLVMLLVSVGCSCGFLFPGCAVV